MKENSLITELQTAAKQAKKDEIFREDNARRERRSAENARLSGRLEEIHALAHKRAQEGETWLKVSRLNFDTYGYKYWYCGEKVVTPDDLYGDDSKLAELLASEGFKLFVGFVCPDDRAGDLPPGSVYNFFGISWEKESKQNIYELGK